MRLKEDCRLVTPVPNVLMHKSRQLGGLLAPNCARQCLLYRPSALLDTVRPNCQPALTGEMLHLPGPATATALVLRSELVGLPSISLNILLLPTSGSTSKQNDLLAVSQLYSSVQSAHRRCANHVTLEPAHYFHASTIMHRSLLHLGPGWRGLFGLCHRTTGTRTSRMLPARS